MTLHQFHALKQWHLRHWREHPLEKNLWEAVLTLWLMGWVGGAVSLLLNLPWVEVGCLALLFLPSAYVAMRARWHRAGRLRCDWINSLR